MTRVAIIGSGISGLGTARFLSQTSDITLFEKQSRLGGHTHTHHLSIGETPVSVDTGFIVHNRMNYPNLIRLLEELNIETCDSDMSFAVDRRGEPKGLSWCSRGLNGVFTERKNILNPRFYGFLSQIYRFNTVGRRFIAQHDHKGAALTLENFLHQHHLDNAFAENYIYPMASSVWSMSRQHIKDFPILTLLRFFQNHGMLGMTTQYGWRTIPGGTSRYIAPLIEPFKHQIFLNRTPIRVERQADRVNLIFADGTLQSFDHVVLACPAPDALNLLSDPSDREREILSAFEVSRNPTILHRDRNLLPPHRRSWASWNFPANPEGSSARLTYHMNRLQPLATKEDLFVTLNGEGHIDPELVERRMDYVHPKYNDRSIAAQNRWQEISRVDRRTHFAGAYWGYGFHEDGLVSGLRVAQALGARW